MPERVIALTVGRLPGKVERYVVRSVTEDPGGRRRVHRVGDHVSATAALRNARDHARELGVPVRIASGVSAAAGRESRILMDPRFAAAAARKGR